MGKFFLKWFTAGIASHWLSVLITSLMGGGVSKLLLRKTFPDISYRGWAGIFAVASLAASNGVQLHKNVQEFETKFNEALEQKKREDEQSTISDEVADYLRRHHG